jgi:D-alanyl-D-alanine carboxypeptidase
MKRKWYYPTPVRLGAAMLCASFLATYSAAADQSAAQADEPSVLEFPASESEEIHETISIALEEESERILYESRAAQWQLCLVNAENPLPDDYDPDPIDIGDGMQFNRAAADSLLDMLHDGQAAGYHLTLCSAYRSIDRQRELYNLQVSRQRDAGKSLAQAQADAVHIVAYPGTSEHATGLAADIVTQEYLAQYSSLTSGFEQTDAFVWLREHCAEYGFVLRYPSDKTEITGIIYEPWHFRFVGQEAAEEMTKSNLCLEEYLGQADSSDCLP